MDFQSGTFNCLPHTVHFLLNDKCNAKCVFCGGDYYRSKSGKVITLDKFARMAGNLHLEHFRNICLAGAGDPLLDPDFMPIVRYTNEQYPNIAITVTTNGIALKPELSAEMMKAKVSLVNISINAATPVTYQRLMQVNQFDTVCANAAAFVREREKACGQTLFQFSCAISRLNIEELPILVELAHRLGVRHLNIFYCRFYPKSIRHLNIEATEYLLEDRESLFFHQELSDRKVMEAKALAERYGIFMAHEPLFREKGQPKKCVWTETELLVGFDGEVYPCGGGEVHFKKKVESRVYQFGNALTQRIEEFWNNDTYRKLRISCRRGSESPIAECRFCANLMQHDDIRSHIMEWEGFEEKASAACKSGPLPLVSVIVPTYNRPDMLPDTLRSILAQTYPNIEIVVVNDAGQDVGHLVRSVAPNAVYIRHECNKGLAGARNTGIRHAKGKYIAYLDDDDIFYPEHIETLVTFLHNTGEKIAYSDAFRAHQARQADGTYSTANRDVPYSLDFDRSRILIWNFIPVLCVIHDIECINEAGYFDEQLRSHEDWDLWIRMSRKFTFHHIKKTTCEFTWRDDGSSMTSSKELEFISTQEVIYSKYRSISILSPEIIQNQNIELRNRKLKAGLLTSLPICSIVVPLYNAVNYTVQMLESLFRFTNSNLYELIIVDNASSDNTSKLLDSIDNQAIIIRNEKNEGFSRACNRGARYASTDFLIFLNSDTILTQNWLEPILNLAISDTNIAIVGNKHIFPDSGKLHHAGICFDENLINSHYLVGIDPADPRVNFQRDFQAVNGACMLVRKCFFDSIGGFNEIYLNGCEDVELCLEARRQGLRVVYTPKSTIMHYGQRSPGRNINDDRNMQIFMSRWKSRISADIKLLAEQESKHVAIKTVHLYPNVIAVLSTFNQPCGIATHTGYVIGGIKEALGDKGEEQRIIVLAEDTSERTGCDDETVFRCWRRGLNDYQEALNIVKRERVTVLHIQFQDGLFAGTDIAGFVRSCKALGVKVFITFHSSEHSLPLCAELVNLADRSFVHLDQSAIRLIAFGAQPNRVRKVTHGILENLNSELSLTKAKNLLDIPQELKIVSSFGFFDQYKGVVEIIQAFPHVLRHHNAAFIFLGGGHPTKPDSLEYIKKCRSVAESLGISDKIIFAKDFLPEKLVSDYLSASDAVVMNYAYIRNEISGAAAFALAHRRPLITSPVPAFRELTDCTLQLSQGLNLAEAIHLALSSPSLRKHLAERTTAYIAQNSYQKLGQTLCDEYGISRTDQQQVTIDVTHTTNECQSKSSTISASEKKKPHYNINWEGPQFMYHSLAHVNRELCKRLSERGHRLSLILTGDTDSFGPTDRQRFESLTERINTPLDAPVDVHVRHWYPPNLTPPAEGHWVMIQPWEMGSVPKRWIDVMSEQLDELWVPTSYVQECYIRSGLPAELVQVIPNGIDTTLFRPDAPSVTLPTSKKWKFLYVGSTTLDRKGFDILIDAYIREFSNLDDVTLVVKDMAVYTGGHNPVANQLRELAKKPGVPEILFIGQDLSGDQLAGIYTACDCLVHAYRGEGFGLPIAEAMSSGLPVIVTGHGAALDFCSNNNAYLIPACEVTLPTKQVYGMETVADPWWAKPDKDALRRLMRHVMSNPAEARMKGAKARRTIEERFTWDMAVTAVEERIALLCSRPVRRFAGKAPQQQDLVEQSSPAVGNLRAEAATPRHASVDGRNILVVAPILPTYDRDSGSFRLFQLLRLMRQEGHHVTFIARGEAGGADPQPYIRALTEIGIEVYPIDPEKLQRFFDINVDAPPVDLKKILTERFYDIAYLYFYHLAAQYLPELRGFSPQTRIVVDSVDFHYLRELRAAEVTGNTKALENAARVRELELGVYRLADLVIAVTNDDRRELLREAPELAVKVIPNIHPVATNVPDFAGRRDILFVGGFPHTPNIDAALYFCTEIWPEVSRRLPEANLYLVGNKPPESIQRLASRRVVVTGYVPDTKSYLEQCRVSIAPLRYGAGMKGKVGEALAAGLPVVATPVAAEGTGLENGRELLVASDAGSFIEAVVALYQNEALWTRLSANGLHFMAKNYSPDVVRLQLNDIIVQLTEIKNNVMKSTWLVDSSKVRDTLRSYGKSYQSLPIYRQI